MRSIFTAFAVVLLWNAVVFAGFEISDFLFRPNFDADKELMERAHQGLYRNDVYQPQGTDTSVEVEIDLCDPENFKEMFQNLTFRPEEYTRYKGLDHTALFASSVKLSEQYAVVGSNGYDVFKGIVHVYVPKTTTKWSLQALIRSPVWDNGNFGNDISVDGERIVVAANAFEKYDGVVFVYEHNPLHNCWLLTATIHSPLASGPNRTMSQGFGYRVGISGGFLIASTAINNAYIYKEVRPGKWVLHTDLQAPAQGIFFGRAVAIEGDLAVVGAYGWERNVGRVFVYRYHPANDSWDLMDQLSPLRTQSNFGYSVDIHNTSIVVGANGYYKYQYENTQQFDARLTQPAVNYGWAYVFQLAANGSKFVMEQEIASPVGNNSYFGSGVGIHGDSIIVGADGYPCFGLTGAGFVFNKGPNGWQLHKSYPSPAGKEGHFGYAVDINANYSAIGAYGFDELRGAIYLADRRPYRYVPPPFPVSLPTMMPTAPSEILSGGGLDRKVNKSGLTLGMLLALALGVLVVAGATGMVIYCCCCMVPIIPLLKKKKKREDEEEESPYTVHSYAGYVEDDMYMPPPRPAPVVLIEQEGAVIEKDLKKEKSVKFMENDEMRKLFPYKVYGPRGYVEEGSEQGVPEDLLAQKKERDEDDLHAANRAAAGQAERTRETRYEYAEEAVPMKGLPPAPAQPDPRSYGSRRDSYGSQHSQYDYQSRHMQREHHHSEQRASWVERARQNYESSYSLQSQGTALTEEDGTVYNSLSSMTSQSQQPAVEHQRLQQRAASFYNYDDLHDDETVMSGATQATQETGKSGGSLVGKARDHYRKILSQTQQMQQAAVSTTLHQVTTTTTTTATTTQNIVQEADSTSGLSGSGSGSAGSSGGSGGSGFVAAAREKYARLKSGGQPVAEGRSQSREGSSVGDEETRGSSLVDKLKARGAALSESGASGFVVGSEASASHVAAARARYQSLQRQGLGIASASADINDTGDGDGASVVTRSSALSAGSGGSLVDGIKARYAQVRAESSSAASQYSTSSGQASLVDQIKAKHRASLHSEPSGASTHEDDGSTVLTQSTADSRASQVDIARAKYMKLRELRRQALGSDAGSVQSGESRSTDTSLVEAARARGEAFRRAADTSVATAAEGKSDAQSVMSQSQSQATSVSQQSYSESGDQSSYMVSAIKARYQASTRLSSAQSTSSYSQSSSTHTEHAVAEAPQDDAGSQKSSAPSSGSSVDSARSAAMSKFAFYKAKAEAEAAKARSQDVSSQSSQSSVPVRLKERVGPLRRADSEWTMDDVSEAVTAMSVGDERSMGASASATVWSAGTEERSAASAGYDAEDVRARAMARAREKFARAKELAGQGQGQAQEKAATTEQDSSGRSGAVEEALRRLRESHNIPDPVAGPSRPVGPTTAVLHHSKIASSSRTVTESATHSRSVDAAATVTREAARSPEEP